MASYRPCFSRNPTRYTHQQEPHLRISDSSLVQMAFVQKPVEQELPVAALVDEYSEKSYVTI